MNKDDKILVLGSTGLVGSAVVRKLKKLGYTNIFNPPHTTLELEKQVQVLNYFMIRQPEYVFHCAAKVGGILANSIYPADFIYNNIVISSNIINACHKFGVKKLLNLGSSCIYPKDCPQPIKEEDLLSGKLESTNEPYAIAKITAIKMCSAFNKQYGTNFISAMPPNLYGINDNFDLQTSHLLPALIRKFYEAKINNTTVTLWGDGSPRREFMLSDDLADGLIFLMNNYDYNGEDFINIGVGEDLPIHLIASAIMTEVGYKGNIIWDGSKPNGTMEKLLDSTKINELGWKPKTNLVTGIHNMYKWFIKNYPNIKGI
jgi:GDP-L-fucose synthase